MLRESHAREKGFSARAYDFRRDKGVRERMEEIRAGGAGQGKPGDFQSQIVSVRSYQAL